MLHCSSSALVAFLVWLLVPVVSKGAPEARPDSVGRNSESWSNIVAGFSHPRRDCSQVPFWFWNGPLEPEEFRTQLREMASKGVYGAMPHPRFGMDRREYLEEPFWRAMAATLEEAEKLRMQIWLYDDYNWPSGGAGGRVTDGRPDLYPRGLDYSRLTLQGGKDINLGAPTNTEPRMERFEKYVGAFIRPQGGVDDEWQAWGTLDGNSSHIRGPLPAGSWEVLAFFQSLGRNPSPLDDGSNSMTDYLSAKPWQRFVELTHEQHWLRFSNYFGKVIPACFSDESSTTAPAPFPWTEDFALEFANRRGSRLLPQLPGLLASTGQEAMGLRMAYWQTVTDLYSQRHLGNYGQWCRAHGLKFTGHVYEENIANYAHAPELFDLLRPMDYPGFDALGTRCEPHGAKAVISLAHLENREEALCESLGLAGGWNCTLDMLRTGYNQLGWLGASRFVPHAFFQTVENPRVECPPSFFFQNPYWKYYRAIADLSARLSWFNRLGHHVAPCAVYYPIESLWADSTGGKGQSVLPWQHRSEGNANASRTIKVFNDLIDQLCAARWDVDIVDDKLLSRSQPVDSKGQTQLQVGAEQFRFILVPPVTALGRQALRALNRFAEQGGRVIWVERLPQCCWPLDDQEPTATLTKWFPGHTPTSDAVGTRSNVVFLASASGILHWLERNLSPEIPCRGELRGLRVSHRRTEQYDLFLLFNDSSEFIRGTADLSSKPECIVADLDDGQIYRGTIGSDGLEVELRPHQSVVAIFSDAEQSAVPLPQWRIERPTGRITDLSKDWLIQLAGSSFDQEWSETLGDTFIELPVFRTKKRDFQAFDGWQATAYDAADWPELPALRGNALFTDASTILFRATLPPGARGIVLPLPVTGEYAIWVDGQILQKRIGPPAEQVSELPLPVPAAPGSILAMETISHAGPTGLERPLKIRCGPVHVERVQSWSEWGFGHYAGRVLYRKEFTLKEKPSKVWLDLGQVQQYVEVWVNGRKAGLLLWPPYELDITEYCQKGQNRLALVVANSIANRFAWDIWGTRGSGKAEPSGVLGPVVLQER